MSTDYYEIFFSNPDPDITSDKARGVVEDIFSKNNLSITNLSHGNEPGRESNKVVQIEANETLDVLKDCLKAIDTYSDERPPYARYFFDQAGEAAYYVVAGDDLAMFASFEDLNNHLECQTNTSPEQLFYSRFGDLDNLMLLRLKVKAKKFKAELRRICSQYVENPNDESFSLIKQFVDQSPTTIDVDFPNMIIDFQNYTGVCDVEIAKSLCFCETQGDLIFLGFNSDLLCKSAEEVLMGETDAMNLVEVFSCCKAVKDSRAKIWSKTSNSEKEWYIYDPSESGMMCFPLDKSAVSLWANPY